MSIKLFIVFTILLLFRQLCISQVLSPGSAAPNISVSRWVKGKPIEHFEKGRFYVVEFWATWCGPCKANIPHLTELAKKYKGQVSVVGVSIWENAKPQPGDYIKRVSDFVSKEGSIMDYNVAVDGPKDDIANSWVVPAGEKGIPCSFIVDRDGKVAWIGYPAKMDEVLAKVVDNTYDPKPEYDKRELAMRVMRPIDEAVAAKNYPVVAERIGKAIADKPDLIYRLAYEYHVALFHCDVDKGIATSQKILTDSDHAIGAYQMFASIFATQKDLPPAAYQYGFTLLDDAIKRWPDEVMFKGMKAEALYVSGRKTEAIAVAKEALASSENNPKAVPAAVAMIKKGLAKYQQDK